MSRLSPSLWVSDSSLSTGSGRIESDGEGVGRVELFLSSRWRLLRSPLLSLCINQCWMGPGSFLTMLLKLEAVRLSVDPDLLLRPVGLMLGAARLSADPDLLLRPVGLDRVKVATEFSEDTGLLH